MGYKVAVVGATGNVGREMLAILAEREFPMDEVAAVASSRSTGAEIEIGDTSIATDPFVANPALEQTIRRILDEHMELALQEIKLAIRQELKK